MAISRVRQAGAASNAVAFPGGNTAGDLLVAVVQTGAATTGVTDTAGNTWVKAVDPGAEATIWYAEGCLGGANTVTAANGFGSGFCHVWLAEYSGVAASGSLDQTAGVAYGGAPTSTPNSGSVTTTQAAELLVGGFSNDSGLNYTWDAGWVEQYDDATGGAGRGMSAADQIVASTGAYAASGTTPSSVAGQNAVIATFRAASGGGGGGVRPWWLYATQQIIGGPG